MITLIGRIVRTFSVEFRLRSMYEKWFVQFINWRVSFHFKPAVTDGRFNRVNPPPSMDRKLWNIWTSVYQMRKRIFCCFLELSIVIAEVGVVHFCCNWWLRPRDLSFPRAYLFYSMCSRKKVPTVWSVQIDLRLKTTEIRRNFSRWCKVY